MSPLRPKRLEDYLRVSSTDQGGNLLDLKQPLTRSLPERVNRRRIVQVFEAFDRFRPWYLQRRALDLNVIHPRW